VKRSRLICATIGVAMAAASMAAAAAPAQASSPPITKTQAVKAGTFSFAGLPSGASGPAAPLTPAHQPMNKTLRHTAASQVPTVAGTPVNAGTGGATGFNGLDAVQQAEAGTGAYTGTQLDATPPDQGLCVGQGDVVEGINVALRVYSTSGVALTPAVPYNQFLNLAPEEVTNPDGTNTFGPFLSDPKCYYDPDTGRWFMSILEIALDPATGNFGTNAHQYVAVTQTSDPTGTWNIYVFATTNDGTEGTPSDPGCPCFGDQPLIGADANGFYIATNEYPITGPGFNGAQLYAMSKKGLETGTNTNVLLLQPGMDPAVTSTLGGVAFSLQPATSPAAGYETAANGTEYFQTAQDFGAAPALGTSAQSIAVWNMTNTASLNSATPNVALHEVVVPSELYAQPPNAAQAPGTLIISDHLPTLATNDDRMNQVVFANGKLWSGVNTGVKTPQGPTLSGIAWFATTPATASGGAVSATLAGQGYLAVNGEDIMFPSIGVTSGGKAVMAFTLAGPDNHPSAAWAPVSLSGGAGPIFVAARGMNAGDDLSAVKAFQGHGTIRWGDYSAAVADPSGTVWMATEYISGLEADSLANWATFVAHVTP
jgi:hypothetical protein